MSIVMAIAVMESFRLLKEEVLDVSTHHMSHAMESVSLVSSR